MDTMNKNIIKRPSGIPSYLALIAFIGALCVAAILRVPALELRPVHGDEANQAVKAGMLLEGKGYAYDPHEHHGPSLYYLTLPVLRLCGVTTVAQSSIWQYRAIPVAFGLLLLVLVWPMRDVLGPWGAVWAALFIAVSHAMTYYSRYYVQEMLLVCFTQAAFTAAWRYMRRPSLGYAALVGCCLGLVHATKETSIIIAFSMAAGLAGALVWGRLREGDAIKTQWKGFAIHRPFSHGAIVCCAALLISIVLFSSFFSHLRGPLDSLLTYSNYWARAEGEGSVGLHNKPWHYYLQLLFYTQRQTGPRWTEALTLVACLVGGIAVLRKRRDHGGQTQEEASSSNLARHILFFRRFLVFYALTITILYSIIPYKTPWNLLPFYHGMLLLAGLGAAAIIRMGRYRMIQAILCILILAGLAFMGRQSYQGNFHYPADARNPYVYAHPSTALRRLVARVDDIADISGLGAEMHINVVRPDGDYWPLPWYFRRYTQVGWWHRLPDHADAAMILAAPELYEVLSEHLQDDYLVEFQALRPGVLLHAYIRQDLWDAFMKTRQ